MNARPDFTPRRPRPMLTRGQVQILQLYAQGLSLQEVATALRLSASGICSALTTARRRTGAGNTAQLVALAMGASLLDAAAITASAKPEHERG